MATISHVPIPSSTTKKTTAYTIPAGKYARGRPLYPGCTVNGVELFLDAGMTRTLAAATIELPVPKEFDGKITSTASATTKSLLNVYQSDTATTAFSATSEIDATSGNALTVFLYKGVPSTGTANFAAGNNVTHGFAIGVSTNVSTVFTLQRFTPYDVWLKPGDVLDGGYWLLEEYGG